MEIIVNRKQPIGNAIPGEMTIQGTHAAYTLERLGVCILATRYPVKLYDSPHFGIPMPWIIVPTRDHILIHWGDYPQNSEGCLLVGREQDEHGNIWHTREMFDALFLPIQAAVEREGCWLTINDPPTNGIPTDIDSGDL
jgi:Family of unknown function (DUF5675)